MLSFRNMSHHQVQRGLTERGEYPRQRSCSRSMSTSCVAKCTFSFQEHRLVRTSADPLKPLLQGEKIICVSMRQEEGHHWPACWLLRAAWAERTMQSSSHSERRMMEREQSQLSLGQTGDECTLKCMIWNLEKRSLNTMMSMGSTAPIAVLLALTCTLCVNVLRLKVCVWCVAVFLCVLFPVSLTLHSAL